MVRIGLVLLAVWAALTAALLFEVGALHAQIPQPNLLLRFVLIAPWLLRAGVVLIAGGIVLRLFSKRHNSTR